MTLFIKKTLADKFGVKTKIPRIIYGGDVNEKNARDFLKTGREGVLIGRMSSDAEQFAEITSIAEKFLKMKLKKFLESVNLATKQFSTARHAILIRKSEWYF